MLLRLLAPLLLFGLVATSAPAETIAPPVTDAEQLIQNCRDKAKGQVFQHRRCLLDTYAEIEKKVIALNDLLLGKVGGHRSLGRLKIIQWSHHITKSHRNWKKFIVWDCEWPGHLGKGKLGSAMKMTECRIRRVHARIKQLEGRAMAFDRMVAGDKQTKDK